MSGQNKKSSSNSPIQNAEPVIEAFGGIRPMAKKMDVAVTTVQGWKKRNVIPGARVEQLTKAAEEHDIDLEALLAEEQDNGGTVVAADTSKNESLAAGDLEILDEDDDDPADAENATEADSDTVVASAVAPEVRALKAKIDHVEREQQRAKQSAKQARSFSDTTETYNVPNDKGVTYVIILLLVLGVLAIAAYFWQKSETEKAEFLRQQQAMKAEMDAKLTAVENDVQGVKRNQGFLGKMIPQDLNDKLANLQEQAQTLKADMDLKAQQAQEAAKVASQKAHDVSNDVLAKDAGSLDQRIAKLEMHAQDIAATPLFAGMMARVSSLQTSVQGQEALSSSVGELNALFSALQTTQAQQNAGESSDLGQPVDDHLVNDILDEARSQSDVLNATLGGVPKEDLKAAALLLGMSQLRSSLNRDNEAFAGDVELLKKVVGDDNTELMAALDRLAPHAQQGVLTPSGLSNELRSFAGDAVFASLSGEDVSLEDRASARMNELFQVEKDGELVTGTPTQAAIVEADKRLQSGDIQGAISAVQGLDPKALTALGPWLEQANASLDVSQAKSIINNAMGGQFFSGGKLILNDEAGVELYVRETVPGMPSGLSKPPSLPRIAQ